MAKKKNKQKQAELRPHHKKNEVDVDTAAINKLFGQDLGGAAALGKSVFGDGSLGRVDASRPSEVQDLINQSLGIANFYGPGGQKRSADTQDYVARLKASLEGYTAPELQAQRESMNREINSQYKGAEASLGRNIARSGIRGGVAGALYEDIANKSAHQKAQNEQDIYIKNADEKQKRLTTYGGELSGIEGTEYGRMMDTNKYAQDSIANARADEEKRTEYNLGQGAAEKAGYLATLYGGLGYGLQKKGMKQNKKISLAAIKAAGGTGQRNSGNNSGTSGANPMQGYIDQITALTNQYYGGS